MDSLAGLLLLHKPSGVTSFDCVHVVRRILGAKRVGHCGTLDPMASGLLMVLVGSATRSQESYLGLEKTYWLRGEFGRKSSTGDREGEVTEERSFANVTGPLLETTLTSFEGDSLQTPPMYSALKHKGKPYYEYARKGLTVPRTPRPVKIHRFTLLSLAPPFWEGRVVCSRGTYIRTLVEDVAERLGTCGMLAELIREQVGGYRLSEALSWESLRAMTREHLITHLLPSTASPIPAHA